MTSMRVSLRQAIATDPIAYHALLATGGLWVLVAFMVGNAWWTGRHPQESWAEVLAGSALLTVAAALLCRHRAARINSIIESGAVVRGAVEHYREWRQLATVRVSFEWQGSVVRRRLTLVAGKRTRRLDGAGSVTLAVSPGSPRHAVILDVYGLESATGHGAHLLR